MNGSKAGDNLAWHLRQFFSNCPFQALTHNRDIITLMIEQITIVEEEVEILKTESRRLNSLRMGHS